MIGKLLFTMFYSANWFFNIRYYTRYNSFEFLHHFLFQLFIYVFLLPKQVKRSPKRDQSKDCVFFFHFTTNFTMNLHSQKKEKMKTREMHWEESNMNILDCGMWRECRKSGEIHNLNISESSKSPFSPLCLSWLLFHQTSLSFSLWHTEKNSVMSLFHPFCGKSPLISFCIEIDRNKTNKLFCLNTFTF